MNTGWLMLHRELMDKPIWTGSTPEQKVILMTLLMMANHTEQQWEWKGMPYVAKPGQFVTSLPSIVQKSGKNISIQNVRTALKRFEKYDFLTDESTNQNRLITIVNWGIYQVVKDEPTASLTDNQQTTNRQLTSSNNVKKEKNEKKSNSRQPVYDTDSPAFILASYFYKQILQNNPGHKEPNFQKWADDVRKLLELDKRDKKEVGELMRWVQKDDFEMAAVESPAKLRKRYDNLVLKMRKAGQAGQVAHTPTAPPKEFEFDPTKGE